jgi:hypothetical protein
MTDSRGVSTKIIGGLYTEFKDNSAACIYIHSSIVLFTTQCGENLTTIFLYRNYKRKFAKSCALLSPEYFEI